MHRFLALIFVVAATGTVVGGVAAPPQLPGSNIIPSNRLIRWEPGVTVGVPEGIPNARTACQTAQCQALTNASADIRTGVTDASALIQTAINSAPAQSVVLIPAGTWRIGTRLTLNHNRDSITLRGAGAATVLDCRSSTCLYVGTGSDYQWAWPTSGNIVTGYAADPGSGGTTLSIASTSAFGVNQMIRFAVANDPTLPVISVAGFEYRRRQMSKVISKTATSITVFPPIYGHERFMGLDARVNVAQFQTDSVGIEDVTLDGGNGSVSFGVWFEQTYGSWLKNVTVIRSGNYNVYFSNSLNCELRHSHLDVLSHAGSNGAGLLIESVTGCLVEDNIIRESFPNIEVNHGSAGNVFGYNFIHNRDGLIGINTNHGPHNSFNLYEGNAAHNIMSDGYFGGNSDDTIYRNLLHGNGIGPGDTLTYCLSLKRFTRTFSIVGNILGSPKHTGRCDHYGQPNIGNGSSNGTAQPSAGDFWADWAPPAGTRIYGTLTGRSDNFHGIVTLSSGSLIPGQAPALWPASGTTMATWVMVGTVAGNTVAVDSSPWQVALPPLNTSLRIEPGAGGFQELDMDVEATTLKKGNNFVPTGIPPSESLGGTTLPASLYRTAKPSWFGQLPWPPFDPGAPSLTYEAIPAGYRLLHGVPSTPTGVRIVK